jgi:hypothetical protein
MSRRTAAWFAWSMWATSLALTALSFLLLALNFSHPDVPLLARKYPVCGWILDCGGSHSLPQLS